MNGSASRNEVGEKNNPVPGDANLLGWVALGGTYGPTGNHKKALGRAQGQLADLSGKLDAVVNKIEGLKMQLKEVGAP